MMTRQEHIETNAALLRRAILLLDQAHTQLIVVADITRARQLNRIISSLEIERNRWLHTVGSTML